MTELRDELRSGRRAYQAVQYPGDLAGELLPRQSLPGQAFGGRPWIIAGACSAAASVLLAFLLLRPSTDPLQNSAQRPEGAVVDAGSIAGNRPLVPHFETPVLPLLPPGLQFQLPPAVENYPHYAMQYRELRIPDAFPKALRHPTVPTIPADLPTRGVQWLQRVWVGEKAA